VPAKLSKPTQYLWSKLGASKWEDAWIERLQFLGPGRIAIFSLPGSKRIRIEAYGLNSRDAAKLVKTFGGQTRPMKAIVTKEEALPPLLIRDKLIVVRSKKAADEAACKYPGRPTLIIPAAMAFGTGDHATTSTCLRMISDFAETAPARWEALDLGTGTGILAFAARVFGAARCDAWDFDPACVRATRENARINNIRNVPAARVDVTEWTPARQWDLVTANLYSTMLVRVADKIRAALKPNATLILSGMLAAQAPETLAVFRKHGIEFKRVVKRGKWVTAFGSGVTASGSPKRVSIS
jgi:ribosomal protein L11 methyltransferase